MTINLARVDARKRLQPRVAVYWQRLSEGRSVGFRRKTKDSVGSWLARIYIDEQYKQKRLGKFDAVPVKSRFDANLPNNALCNPDLIFTDGFESGNTSAWSNSIP